MNTLDRLKQQFQKTAGSLANFHKTATNLEKQAYFQGQYDILSQILLLQSFDGLMDWIKKKREEVLQTLEKNSLLFKISKHPLILPEPTTYKIKASFLEEPPVTSFQVQQPQFGVQFEEENCNNIYNQFIQSDGRKRRKDFQSNF